MVSSAEFDCLLQYARGNALIDLLKQALIAPQIIHYQQIVSHPRVVELAESGDPQAEDLMRTLNLFNHGNIEDYRVEEHKYKPLSLAESEKLQMLSLMTLSMKNRIVKYDFVIDKLGMIPGDYAKLEELMMNTMCMGYLVGQMDQEKKCLYVSSVVGRDIPPEEVGTLSEKAGKWCDSLEKVLKETIATENAKKEKESAEKEAEKRFQEEIQSVKRAVRMEEENRRDNDVIDIRGEDSYGQMRPKKSKIRPRKN